MVAGGCGPATPTAPGTPTEGRVQQSAGVDCRKDLVSSWGTRWRPCTGTLLSMPTSLLPQAGTASDGMRTTLASSLLGRTVKPPGSGCVHMSNTGSARRVTDCQGRAAPTWTVGTHRAGVRPSELQCRPRELATFLTHVIQSLPPRRFEWSARHLPETRAPTMKLASNLLTMVSA